MKVIWVNSCTTIQYLKVSCIAIECLKKYFPRSIIVDGENINNYYEIM